jgi:hypothetical protein
MICSQHDFSFFTPFFGKFRSCSVDMLFDVDDLNLFKDVHTRLGTRVFHGTAACHRTHHSVQYTCGYLATAIANFH